MARTTIDLKHGFKVGDQLKKKLTLREAETSDITEAQADAELLKESSKGPALVHSPARMTLELLRRIVVSIDDHSGPLSMMELKHLHKADFNALYEAHQKLEAAALQEVAPAGRSAGSNP